MPVIKRKDGSYELIVSNDKLSNLIRACIVREPSFKMRWHVLGAVTIWAVGLGLMLAVTPLPDWRDMTNGSIICYIFGMLMMGAGFVWLNLWTIPQYDYRRGKIGRGVEVLTHEDYFWHTIVNHPSCPWPRIAPHIEQGTINGRIFEGIILRGLQEAAADRQRAKENPHDWRAVQAVNRKAFDTAQELSTTVLQLKAREAIRKTTETIPST